jgi:hypothetical protein
MRRKLLFEGFDRFGVDRQLGENDQPLHRLFAPRPWLASPAPDENPVRALLELDLSAGQKARSLTRIA